MADAHERGGVRRPHLEVLTSQRETEVNPEVGRSMRQRMSGGSSFRETLSRRTIMLNGTLAVT